MAAIASLTITPTEYRLPVPNLIAPDEAQGEDGGKLQDLIAKIINRWEAQPPRSVPRTPRFFVEPDEDQAKANQVALTRLQSWQTEGDAQEQAETFAYLRRTLNEDRLSERPLF